MEVAFKNFNDKLTHAFEKARALSTHKVKYGVFYSVEHRKGNRIINPLRIDAQGFPLTRVESLNGLNKRKSAGDLLLEQGGWKRAAKPADVPQGVEPVQVHESPASKQSITRTRKPKTDGKD